jgi:hypothetical protein
MANFRQVAASHQTNVACANHRNFQRNSRTKRVDTFKQLDLVDRTPLIPVFRRRRRETLPDALRAPAESVTNWSYVNESEGVSASLPKH